MSGKRKLKVLGLALATCAAAALAYPVTAQAEAFTPEQKTELNKLFEQYLMENGEVLLKSVDAFRSKKDEQTAKDAQQNLKKHEAAMLAKDMPGAGNPEGDATIVEFFDYNCGYCKRMYQDLVTMMKDDPKLRVVFVDLPILSPASDLMARYSLAAHKQGKYFEFHQVLMDHRGQQTPEAFEELAKKIGLDVEKLKKDMSDPSVEAALVQHRQMAQDLGIQGTPGLVIGEQIYRGYIGLEGVKQSIKEVREKKPAQ